jgi:hypothetical protein
MLANVADQNLLERLVPLTMSCAHPEAQRWRYGRVDEHCGYCLPCIIRRAATHAADVTDATYLVDVLADPPDSRTKTGHDLRAVQMAVERFRGTPQNRLMFDVLSSGPLPAEDVTDYTDVYRRGMEELAALLEDGS